MHFARCINQYPPTSTAWGPQVWILRNAMLSIIAYHPVLSLSVMCRSSFAACSYKCRFPLLLKAGAVSPLEVRKLCLSPLSSIQLSSKVLFALSQSENFKSSSRNRASKLCILCPPTVALATQIHLRMLLLFYPVPHIYHGSAHHYTSLQIYSFVLT